MNRNITVTRHSYTQRVGVSGNSYLMENFYSRITKSNLQYSKKAVLEKVIYSTRIMHLYVSVYYPL